MASDSSIHEPEQYRYEPLRDPSSQVRALWLKPADSPYCIIEFSLEIRDLNDWKYVACLNGPSDRSEQDYVTLCNGDLFLVNRSIYKLLSGLRTRRWQHIWFDSLCIDLSNPEEHQKQLVLQPEILRKAIRCFPAKTKEAKMKEAKTNEVGQLIMEGTRDKRFGFDNFVKDNQHPGMEDWKRKEVERLTMERTRDKRFDFDNFAKDIQDQMAQLSQPEQDEANEAISKGFEGLEDVQKEIMDKDVELFNYAKEFTDSRAASGPPFQKTFCDSCELEIASMDTFWICAECRKNKLAVQETETGHTVELGFRMCNICYLHKAKHRHDGNLLIQFAFIGYDPCRVVSPDLHFQQSLFQTIVRRKEKVMNPRYTDYRKTVQIQDRPLSKMLSWYLDVMKNDLSQHRYFQPMMMYRSITGNVTNRPQFQMLQNFTTICFLLADFRFFQRTKRPSFLSVLSPIQRASVKLLKEWWLSEIQDPKLMMSTIASYITDCMLPDHDRPTNWFFNQTRNKYHKDYHGTMEKLFDAEFGTFENGIPTGASANLFLKRTTAGREACIQRLAYLTGHPSMNPPWWDRNSSIDSDFIRMVQMQCYRWRLNVRLGCTDLLLAIRLSKGPEDFCWDLIDMATKSPVELFIADYLFNEQVFGPKRLSATLTPLPWLSESNIFDSLPHFLWDVRDQQTIETSSLGKGFRPQYIAVSHTWGRWKRRSEPSLKIPGVPWLVPQNDLWDVLLLPQQLRKIPGRYRFVWFDLVCIPQDVEPGSLLSQIERKEISNQAAIFGNAAQATIWLSTVEDHEFEDLQTLVGIWAAVSGKFMMAWERDELERLHTSLFSKAPYFRKTWRNMRESIPLVCKDRRSLLGTSADPIEYVHPWFTSLWTLQELCMRPDMWVCRRDWTPLRIHNTEPWQNEQNLAFDGILALLDKFKYTDLLASRAPDWLWGPYKAPLTEAEAEAQAKIKAEEVRREFFCPGVFDDDFSKRSSVEEAMRTGDTPDIIKALGLQDRCLYGMLCATGMSHLLDISPMDILVLADRRQCKRDKNRAEAIMSAIGAIEWYEKDTTANQELVYNRYPISFLTEVREKVGDGEFFRSRFLNYAARKIVENFRKTDKLPPAAGTALPFGVDSTFAVAYSQLGTELDPEQQESHPSLQTWRIQLDASVTLSKVGILASTQKTMGLYECLYLTIEEVGVYHEQEEGGAARKGKDFIGHPEKWLNERQHRCYLVCVDWLERYSNFSTARVASHISRGLVLQELTRGYLVKIGSYMATGCREHVFPQSDEVNWTIL